MKHYSVIFLFIGIVIAHFLCVVYLCLSFMDSRTHIVMLYSRLQLGSAVECNGVGIATHYFLDSDLDPN